MATEFYQGTGGVAMGSQTNERDDIQNGEGGVHLQSSIAENLLSADGGVAMGSELTIDT